MRSLCQRQRARRDAVSRQLGWGDVRHDARRVPQTVARLAMIEYPKLFDEDLPLFNFAPAQISFGGHSQTVPGERAMRHPIERCFALEFFHFHGYWTRLPFQIELPSPRPDPKAASFTQLHKQLVDIINAVRSVFNIGPRPDADFPPGVEGPRGGFFLLPNGNNWKIKLWPGDDGYNFLIPDAEMRKVFRGPVRREEPLKLMVNITSCDNEADFRLLLQWAAGGMPWVAVALRADVRKRLYQCYKDLEAEYAAEGKSMAGSNASGDVIEISYSSEAGDASAADIWRISETSKPTLEEGEDHFDAGWELHEQSWAVFAGPPVAGVFKHQSPSGDYKFVSQRLHGSAIAAFTVDAKTGKRKHLVLEKTLPLARSCKRILLLARETLASGLPSLYYRSTLVHN